MFHTCLNKLSGGASIPLALLLSLALLIMPAQAGAITADTNAAGGDYDGIMKWDSSEFLITDSSGSSTSTVIHVNLEASNTDMGKFKPSENNEGWRQFCNHGCGAPNWRGPGLPASPICRPGLWGYSGMGSGSEYC